MITFSELAKELGISNFNLAKLRDERLSSEEWFMKDGKRFFTEEGANKIRLALEVPMAVPKRAQVKVVQRAPNPRYVYAKFPGNGNKILVVVKPSMCDRLIGKSIYVDLIQDANGTTYRHEALAK